MKISQLLTIQPGMTALIGGGGKTTLMYRLAKELSDVGTVIVCTSTKIVAPDHIPTLTDGSVDAISAALHRHRVICVGAKTENGKLSEPAIGFEKLKQLADYVIVEADGAHRLPIKAHAAHEPVIPEGAGQTVLVIGADCFGKPIAEICHRPQLFAVAAGVDLRATVTPEIVRRVITAEVLGDRLYINKVENDQNAANARALADMLDMPVTAGSLKTEEYLCLR